MADNGNNIVGAERELRENIKMWNTVNFASEIAQRGIKWRFNQSSAPHQGGSWERIVRSFKRILYTILGTRRLTDEVLNTTFFCPAEYASNARLLMPVSADLSNLGVITPNPFLLDNHANAIPSVVRVDAFDHHKRYARA